MGDALAGLSNARDPELNELPILPGEAPFTNDDGFASELADLAHRRFTARPDLLRQEISDIDDLVRLLLTKLRALPQPDSMRLLHGDLIPANVLVEGGEVAGIVDFGFLTTLGDPRFDAAITASIFDMYGANARESEERLSAEFAARFDHDPLPYALYRAAYAIITNAHFGTDGTDGTDGHFLWCASMLRRPEIEDAIRA